MGHGYKCTYHGHYHSSCWAGTTPDAVEFYRIGKTFYARCSVHLLAIADTGGHQILALGQYELALVEDVMES